MVIAATATLSLNGSVCASFRVSGVPEVLKAPSFLPANERFVHIGGGFFSYFDQKPGSLVYYNARSAGTMSFELNALRHESRFVYLPEGTITLRDDRGNLRCFALERLDYVRLPGSEVPAYRLTGEDITLVATDSGHAAPSLAGELYVRSGHTYECFTISIRGRNEKEAERHLWRKIERVTSTRGIRPRTGSTH